MPFYQKLSSRLSQRLSEQELALLPRSYQIVGRILLLKLDKKLMKHKKAIGATIIEILPYLHSVFLVKEIKDEIRKPRVEHIAGCGCTQTLHKEHGCLFLLDIAEIMFSKGNKAEKLRMIKLAKVNETIVDMFAGIGYWSIPIAKHTKAKKIYSIEINPKAVKYLEKNAWLNRTQKIEILQGDCRKFSSMLENTADRIIMGYIFFTEKFLPTALEIAKNGCTIHFHKILSFRKKAFMERNIDDLKRKIEAVAKNEKCRIKFVSIKKVKSYAPRVWHFVFDLKVTK